LDKVTITESNLDLLKIRAWEQKGFICSKSESPEITVEDKEQFNRIFFQMWLAFIFDLSDSFRIKANLFVDTLEILFGKSRLDMTGDEIFDKNSLSGYSLDKLIDDILLFLTLSKYNKKIEMMCTEVKETLLQSIKTN